MPFRLALTFLVVFVVGCGIHNATTFSGDDSKYGKTTVTGSPQFTAVNSIVSANCAQCHSFATYSESDWIQKGYVVPGDPMNSKLFQRLNGSGVGPQDMPLNGALSAEDIKSISDWITQISTS